VSKRDIPILDLKIQYRAIKRVMEESILKVMASGQYILGPEVEAFEKEFAFYLKTKNTIGVNSGTDALKLALKACGVGKDDEVITTPSTFIATVEAIVSCGAKPVFVDVNESDSNMNVDQIEEKITKKTKAILPVHLYGFVCDMGKIMEIAKKHKLKVVEDCAQSVGAYYGSQRTGAIGDAGCFSFYPTKNLGAYGDGGSVSAEDTKMAEHIRALRTHGSEIRGYYDELGINSRLDEMQATILRVKLLYIDRWNAMRRKLGFNYDELLQDVSGVSYFQPGENTTPVYHLYCIRSKNRETLQERLAERGITTMVHYPIPLHLAGALSFLGHKEGDFPVAEEISKDILALPIYPELTFQHQEEVAQEISNALKSL